MAAEHAQRPDRAARSRLRGRPGAHHGPGDLALAHLDTWRAVSVRVGWCSRSSTTADRRSVAGPGDAPVRRRAEVPVVLSNAVRYVDALDAPTADVLTPPAGWFRSPRATSPGPRRATSSRARRWPRSAEDLVGPDRDAALRLLFERTARAGRAVRGRHPRRPRHRQRPLSRARRRHHSRGAGDGSVAGAAGPLRGPGLAGGGCRCPNGCGSGSTRSWGSVDSLGYPSYFLTVADVVDLIKSLRVRAAARWIGCRQPGHLHLWASPTSTRSATAC